MTKAVNPLPYWWEHAPPQSATPSDVGVECDVAIVGAGYTGLSAALTLSQAGKSVQIFDKDLPGAAASSRNGGITSGSLRRGFSDLAARFGEQRARDMLAEAQQAREFLRQLITDNNIDCDYDLAGLFTGALTASDFTAMQHEATLLNDKAGIELQIVTPDMLADYVGSGKYAGGVLSPAIGTIHPAKLVAGLVKAATEAGAVLHAETAVLGVRRQADSFYIKTPRGQCRAQQVLVATNGYGDDSDKWLRRRIVPVKSRIVVTEELSPNLISSLMPNRRAMGERKKLYRYFRPTPDGKRILMGGREPPWTNDLRRSIEHGRQALTSIFPQLRGVDIAHSWSGHVAFSRPQIPQFFSHDGIHYALGYCGSGTVWAPWFGNKAALKILNDPRGRTSFESASPPSIPLYRGKPWFIPAVIAGYGVQDWLNNKT
ncbi:MAG: FAD-dependent oxidoreductase [Rhizobiaceae bacterium]